MFCDAQGTRTLARCIPPLANNSTSEHPFVRSSQTQEFKVVPKYSLCLAPQTLKFFVQFSISLGNRLSCWNMGDKYSVESAVCFLIISGHDKGEVKPLPHRSLFSYLFLIKGGMWPCVGSGLCLWSADIWSFSVSLLFFVSHPRPLQAPDKHGLTPLISACFENHLSCVKLLLAKVGTLYSSMP